LSPENFEKNIKGNPDMLIKNDVFCLGLTALEMVILDLGKRWYFEGTNELNIELVNKSLHIAKIRYSQCLYEV